MNNTTVVNAKDVTEWTDQHVYIGRGALVNGRRLPRSAWGNPFKIGPSLTRAEAVARHRQYIEDQVRHSNLGDQIRAALRGKILVCHCAPLACHGEVLAELANRGEVTP